MSKSGGHVNTIGTDGFCHLENDINFANFTGDLHQIIILQPKFLRRFRIHPQTGFILIFVKQLVILSGKLGVPANFARQQVKFVLVGVGWLFPGRPGRETGICQRLRVNFDFAAGRIEGNLFPFCLQFPVPDTL